MTRYVPLRLGTPRIERRQIPRGFAGTAETAAHVARLIREGASDFYVRQKAIDVLLAQGVAPKDYIGEIDAIFRWVQRYIRYTKDPFRVEVLHTPRRMLELRAGDCDDMTILLGALVKSIGHPVRLVLTGPDARRPDLFSHIYLEAQCQGDWIPLDATMPFSMGWSPRAPVRLVLSIEEESTDDRPASRTTAAPSRIDPDLRTAAPRLAAQPAARHPAGGRSAARPAREGHVESPAPASTARAERVDQDRSTQGLATGPAGAASSAYHATDVVAPQRVGHPLGSAAAPVRQRDASAGSRPPAHASSAARDAAPRRHGPPHAATSSRPPGRSATTGTLKRTVADAARLYGRFTQLPASSLRRVSHPRVMPPVVAELGRLVAVVYRSDKWVGHPRTYIHYMEDPPTLASDVAGRRLFLIGGSYRITARGIEG